MQKFLRVIIIISLFVICLLIGANLANISLTDNQVKPVSQIQEDETQTRILVYVVDNFEKRKPELMSIWSVIFYYQDSQGLMFVPLVFDADENFNEYEKSFIVTADRTIHERTIKFFNTKFRTNWNSYIIMDQAAVSYLTSWISLNEIKEVSIDNESLGGNIEKICSLLLNHQIAQIDGIEWSLIFPHHMNSDLSIEQMKNLWEKLSGSNLILCEIIQ